MNEALLSAGAGYLTALIGFLMGGLIAFGTKKYGDKFQGTLMGFTGGLLIAFVCFELLPNAFEGGSFYGVIAAMLFGVLATTYMDGKATEITRKLGSENTNKFKMGFILAFGIIIHNIPEGVAIGSLFAISNLEGFRLCLIIALHCIPEGLAVAIPLKGCNMSFFKILCSMGLLALPMGIGSFLGGLISIVSNGFISICFAFAGGVMLYITCGEIIPDANEVWSGRLTTIGALIGFTLGIILVSGV